MSVFGQNCVLLNNGWFPVNLVKTDSNKETVVEATETGFLDWSLQISFGDGGAGLITVYCVVSDGEDNCHYQHQNITRSSVAAGLVTKSWSQGWWIFGVQLVAVAGPLVSPLAAD